MLSNDRITILEAKVKILEALVEELAARYQDILEKENNARS